MKSKTLKMILQKGVSSAIIAAMLLGNVSVEAAAISEIKEQIAEDVKNSIEGNVVRSIAEKAEEDSDKDSSEETNPSPESEDAEKEEESSEETLEEEIPYETIEINSVDDLIEFSQNCRDTAWSFHKIIELNQDLDLSGTGFVTIPYFDGNFHGNGHLIKGYGNLDDSYITGFFRYIGAHGQVDHLNVDGNIPMKDELKYTGGICGMNEGIILECVFSGSLMGNQTVGSIAAINENNGYISSCTNNAHISGYYFTGGIVGKNYGTISGCKNNGNINDNEEWVAKDDEKGESLLQSITSDDADANKLHSGIDTGGIAGYSKGVILRCENKANIGYEHVGYNVGGIAGRQMGIISYCTNSGHIFGRKDIGGIVGQMEPYLEEEDLQTLPEAADKLHDLINKTLEDMDGSVDVISSDVTSLTGYADGVVNDGRALAGELTTSVNENVRVINGFMERFEYVLQNMPGVINHVSSASDKLYYFNQSVARAVEDINVNDSLSEDDRRRIEEDTSSIYDDLAQANARTQEIEALTSQIDSLMYETDENGDYVFDEMGNRKLRVLNEDELNQLNGYLARMQEISADSGKGVAGMFGSTSDMLEAYKPYADSAGDSVIGEAGNAISALQDAESELNEAAKSTRSIVDYLNSQEKLRFTGLGSDWDNSLDSLKGNLHGITGSIESINQNSKGTSHTLNANLEAVNDQVNVIYHLLSDRLDIIANDDAGVFTDISEEEIEQAKNGRVDSSFNKGTIRGDINIGGIAGAMAIDDEDQEENAAGNISIGKGSKYTLKNIICECKNDSTVESKKDGAGLIVGYMAQGVVSSCEGYGFAKSTEGNYTGGIAGESLSIIRGCNALCLIQGNKYVGGITGYGTTITDCNAMITWEDRPDERYGVIAGIVNTDDETRKARLDNVYGNSFVAGDIGGIDDISYSGKAEPVSYEEILTKEKIPQRFRHLTVSYMIDDEKLGEQELKYGDKFDKLELPGGEERDGYYVKWPDVSDRVMEGDYVLTGEYVVTEKSVASSSTYEDTDKDIAILGGSFASDASITAEVVNEPAYEMASRITEQNAVVYHIAVDEGSHSQSKDKNLRLYNPYSGSEVNVKVYEDGKWQKVDSDIIGSYIEIPLEDADAYYAVIEANTIFKRLIKAGGLAVILAFALAVIKTVRGRIKRKKRQPEKKEN